MDDLTDYLDINFPREIAGFFSGGAEFSTEIVETSGRYEIRNKNWDTPKSRYIMTQNRINHREMDILNSFFLICGGCEKSFNFLDLTDNKINYQYLADGDGSTTEFQVFKNYIYGDLSFQKNVGKLTNVKVFIDDIEVDKEKYSIDCGKIVFNTPPVAGSKIFIDATFYHIVRFKNDYLQARYLNFNTVEINDLELIEVCLEK